MVSDREFYRAVCSYHQGRRLLDGLSHHRRLIYRYLQERGTRRAKTPGFVVEISRGEIFILERPLVNKKLISVVPPAGTHVQPKNL